MISLNANLKFLQQQMGHASITTTMDPYAHLLPEATGEAAQKLNNPISSEKVVPFRAEKVEEQAE